MQEENNIKDKENKGWVSGGDGEDRQTAGKRRKKEKEGKKKLKNGTSLVEVSCLTEQHRAEGAPPS